MNAPALEKGLEVLEALVADGRALTLSQLAERLGRNVSQIQRMVRVLHASGYLDRNSQGGYSPGFRVFQLGRFRHPYRFLQEVAEPVMHDFSVETGHSVHLGVEDGGRMLNLAEARGSGMVAVTVRMGTTLPLEETISGRVLLVAAGRGRRADAVQMEEAGYLSSESPLVSGVNDLGAPIRDRRGGRLAALTCSWLLGRGVPKEEKEATVAQRLRETAGVIETRLESTV